MLASPVNVTAPKRYPTLDVLRLVAITLTMLAHAAGIVHKVFLFRPFQGGLSFGVDLFMLISGWLLGGQLLRDAARGQFEPRRFYVKRWLRTLPPYYFMLILLFCFGVPVVGGLDGTEFVLDTARADHLHPGLAPHTIFTHLTFLQRYWPPNLYGVSWSLCVEEHFYLVLPLLVVGLMKRPRFSTLLAIVVGFEALAVICRLLTFQPAITWLPQQSHMRCHGLFLGLAFAWVNIHRPELWTKLGKFATLLGFAGIIATLAIMAAVPQDVPTPWVYVWVPTFVTWTLALLFVACVHESSPFSRARFPGLQYLGELTYAIYLVHNVLPRQWLGEHSGQAGLRGVVLRLVLVGGFSVLLHHVVERPALKFRDHVLRRWRAASAPAPRAS